ncbi:MAG: hypothetical protein ACFFDY_09550 [Candidatus Thorarchaeota archaeon]
MSEKKENNPLRFFNEAVEYIDKYDSQEIFTAENRVPLENRDYNSNFLRDEMINELNNLKDLIKNNPDLKIEKLTKEERETFYQFINWARICPLCGNSNHFFNLKRLFFDEDKKFLVKEMLRLMTLNSRKLSKYNLHLGIPCCNCYKQFFEE